MKPAVTFVVIAITGFAGICLGAVMNLEGYLGNVFAIAAAGSCIVYTLERRK